MPRFLHAADLHLDSPLQGLAAYEGAPVQQIREATRRALENLVDLALDQQVDFVLMAGDLYDGDWRDHNTGLFFVRQAARLVNSGIPLFVIQGNHDAANQMTRSLRLPKNPDGSEMFLSSTCVESRRLDDFGVALHGRGFQSRAEMENLSAEYPLGDRGYFNIGLLHTSLTGGEGHDTYAPCTPEQLIEKGYDYWALGHIHRRRECQGEGASLPAIVFPGNCQGRHIRETGAKGCVIVDFDGPGNCQRTFHTLDVVRWEPCEIDAATVAHVDALSEAFGSWLGDALQEVEDRTLVVRVRVVGSTPLHDLWLRDPQQVEADLRSAALSTGGDQVWLERVRFDTQPPPIADDAHDLDGPLGELVAVLQAMGDDEQLRTKVAAQLEPLRSKVASELPREGDFDFRPQEDAWIRRLLQETRPLLLRRLRAAEETP